MTENITRFNADQAALWLAEIGMLRGFMSLMSEHEEFFRARSRRAALKDRLDPGDTPDGYHGS